MKRLALTLTVASLGVLLLARCGEETKAGPDAGTPAGADAAALPGPDAAALPGPDAAALPGPDAAALPGPDAATAGPDAGSTGPCDPFAQTGCGANLKCGVDQAGNLLCDAVGTKTDQQTCTADTECAAGLACVGITGETGNKCRRFCQFDGALVCPAQQACVVQVKQGADPILCAAVPACDPWAQTGCAANQKCTLVDFQNLVYTCGPAGTNGDQVACTSDAQCVAGTVCADFGAGFKCHSLCNATKTCPGTASCIGKTSTLTSKDPVLCIPTTSCDLLTQNCSSAAQACYPTQTSTTCAPAGSKTEGQACTAMNQCGKGLVCAGTGTCYKLCDPNGGAPTCTTGTCVKNGANDWGLCQTS